MTSRQRVLNAIAHRPVDRVPIDLGMHPSTGINGFAYYNLRKALGLSTERIEITDPTQFLARVDEDVMRRFHVDCIQLHPGFRETRHWNPRGEYEFIIPAAMNPVCRADGSWIASDGTSAGLVMPDNGFFFDGEGFDIWKEDGASVIERTGREAERIFHETEYFTMYCGYSAYFMGDIEFCCLLLTDPEEARAKMENLHRAQIYHFDLLRTACKGNIQGVCLGGDLGTQSGPMLSPAVYEREVHPYVKKLCDYIHQNSDYKIFLHSCGAVRDFIPYFIDEGIDVLNPVQISAAGMEPHKLKEDFGDKITFWGGGCNTQAVLNRGTPEQVRANTAELMKIFKKGSGFVFNQVHNIMGDIKPENIIAMLDTAYANSKWEG